MDEEFGQDRLTHRGSRHQRGELRESMLLHARVRLGDVVPGSPLRVRNISAGGLMAECAAAFEPGEAIEVELRNIGWVSGNIAWVRDGRIGIAFSHRIDPQLARRPVGTGAGESMLVKRPDQKVRRPGLRIE